MRIALLRHAAAEPATGPDFDRRLSATGERELARLLDGVIAAGWRPGLILHSPTVRTTQTAEAVHVRFPTVTMEASVDLMDGHVDGIWRACAGRTDPLLVGHEPTMGRLLARLVGAPPGSTPFRTAGFALVEVDRLPSTAPGVLVAFLSPGFVGWRPR